MVNIGRKAAEAKIGTWRAHDERDEQSLRDNAGQFFDLITESSQEDLEYAGEMIRRAFWLADEGEKYQDEDRELEDHFYDSAENCLREAFNVVGLDEDIAEYRRDWWQGYRHGDIKEPSIEKDLKSVLGPEYDEKDTERFMRAAKAHDENQWEKCSELLEPIYGKVV